MAAAAVLQRLEAEGYRMVVTAAGRRWLMPWLRHYCILGDSRGGGMKDVKDDRNGGEHSRVTEVHRQLHLETPRPTPQR